MKLWCTDDGILLEQENDFYSIDLTIDDVFRADNPMATVLEATRTVATLPDRPRAPIGQQEIWAAGVTYFASREARIEESDAAKDAYELVYDADRPELFFKSTAHRAVGPNDAVRIRRDSAWNVPEPELTLAVNSSGRIFGYCVGNDMSSRDIEGENPLYLPQAKTYDGAAAIGPCILLQDVPPGTGTEVTMSILRDQEIVFSGSTTVGRIRRPFDELVEYLYRETSFPDGCFLMTGAGVVPDPTFTLNPGDDIRIYIQGIGELCNHVEVRP